MIKLVLIGVLCGSFSARASGSPNATCASILAGFEPPAHAQRRVNSDSAEAGVD